MIHEEISYSVNKIPVGHGSHPERNSKQYQISYINPRLKFLIQTQQRSYEKFDGHPLPSFVEHRIWQPQLQDMPTTVYQSHAGRTFVEHRAISLREHERISDRGLDRRIDRSGSRTETCTYSRQYEDSRFSSSLVTQYTSSFGWSETMDWKKDGPSNLVGSNLLVASASDRYRGGFFLIEARSTIYHSRSLLRSDGSSQLDDVAVAVVVGDRGDGDRFILEVTGSDNPAALIATFNGIVMNGCWLLCVVLTGATVPVKQCQKTSETGKEDRSFRGTSRLERNHPRERDRFCRFFPPGFRFRSAIVRMAWRCVFYYYCYFFGRKRERERECDSKGWSWFLTSFLRYLHRLAILTDTE